MRGKRNYAAWLIVAAISAYFVWLASQAIGAHFAQDDPMNMGFYWERGFWGSFWDDIRFWSTAYRPMGAMFYLPIYHLFGLNPVPYRIAVFALIAVNTVLSYRIADLLTGSKAAAALTAVLVCAHGNMGAIYFNTSQIYDILAYFFLAIMLWCYIRFRRRGELTIAQSAVVICAYVAALDAKEIAVVGAGWILAYELLYHHPWKFNIRAMGAAARDRALRVPFLMVLIALVFAAGKSYGPQALSKQSGYVLEMTWHRYFFDNHWYLNDLFYTDFFNTSRLLIFFGALTLLCAIARRRELWWAWFAISTATLPVSFTGAPARRPGSVCSAARLGDPDQRGHCDSVPALRIQMVLFERGYGGVGQTPRTAMGCVRGIGIFCRPSDGVVLAIYQAGGARRSSIDMVGDHADSRSAIAASEPQPRDFSERSVCGLEYIFHGGTVVERSDRRNQSGRPNDASAVRRRSRQVRLGFDF